MFNEKKIKIIDDFFDTEDFKELSNFKFGSVGSKEIKVHHNMISKDSVIKNDLLNNELVLKIHKKYHKRVFELLKELNPEKAELYDYTDLVLIETGSEYKYPIHDDTPNKLLSGVIYLSPEKNSGTSLQKNGLSLNCKHILKYSLAQLQITWMPGIVQTSF